MSFLCACVRMCLCSVSLCVRACCVCARACVRACVRVFCVSVHACCMFGAVVGPNQVQLFLNDHGGPGIQHIGLTSSDIFKTISAMRQANADFIFIPPEFYTQVELVALLVYFELLSNATANCRS